MPAERSRTGLTSELRTPLLSKFRKKTGQLGTFEERASRSLGNGWFVQCSRIVDNFIYPTGLGKCQTFTHYLHNACGGTEVDLDTDLQSKFLLLKVKKISQAFGT